MKRPSVLKTLIALAATLAAGAAWPQQPFDLDPSFRFNADSWYINSTYPLPDGDVIISGVIAVPGEWPIERLGARLNPDGSIDPDFRTFPSMGGKITPWQDQFYCGVGQVVRRFFMDGRIDSSYISIAQAPYCGFLQGGDYHVFPDGRVLVAGGHLLEDSIRGFVGLYGLIWFTNQGYLDTTRVHRTASSYILHLFPLPEDKFICSGYAWNFDGHDLTSTAFRVLPDGALDTTFHAPPGYVNIKAVHALPNGKLIIGGDESWLDNGDTVNLMRLMPDGSLDPTFHRPVIQDYNPILGGNYSNIISSITPLGPDKYVITGRFTEFDGQPRGNIALIDTAGNLLDDLFAGEGCSGFQYVNFNDPSAWTNGIMGISQSTDGNYYIYGSYHGYNDGTTNDTLQRMVSRLHGLNVGVEEVEVPVEKPLTIYPNPASSYTTLAYDFKAALDKAYLSIRDVVGKEVQRLPIQAAEGQTVWDTRSISPGAYTVELVNGGKTLGTAKLIVKR